MDQGKADVLKTMCPERPLAILLDRKLLIILRQGAFPAPIRWEYDFVRVTPERRGV